MAHEKKALLSLSLFPPPSEIPKDSNTICGNVIRITHRSQEFYLIE